MLLHGQCQTFHPILHLSLQSLRCSVVCCPPCAPLHSAHIPFLVPECPNAAVVLHLQSTPSSAVGLANVQT